MNVEVVFVSKVVVMHVQVELSSACSQFTCEGLRVVEVYIYTLVVMHVQVELGSTS